MGKKNVVWNSYISKNERFADLINGVVFRGEQVVLPRALTAPDSKLWRRVREKDSYGEFSRDTVKVWEYCGRKYLFGLEPEDSPHLALPVKYMNYESLEYDRQYRGILQRHREGRDLPPDRYISGFSETDRLVPVATIGIYLGEKPWKGSAGIGEMAGTGEVPPEIRRQLGAFWNDFRVNLLDIHGLGTPDMFRTDLREVFGFLQRQGDKAELVRYVEENGAFRHLEEDAFDVLGCYGGNAKLQLCRENYRTKGGMDMCTALKELEEDARKEGSSLMNELNRRLVRDGRTEDLFRSIEDAEYQRQLLVEYGMEG